MKIARTMIFTLLILGVAAILIIKHQGAPDSSPAAKAIADAKEKGSPAWLFVCGNDPVSSQTSRVFQDLTTEFSGKIVFIQIDFDSPAHKGLLKKYGINTTPTSIFFDSHGKAVEKKIGEKPADEYRDTLAQLLEVS